jgi:hypothetical protein
MRLNLNDFIPHVKQQIAETIVEHIVSFITRQAVIRLPEYAPTRSLGAWLFEENLFQKNPYLNSTISLKVPIIGIGAPAAIFLPPVADLLHTDLLLPAHYEVANAIGAAAGEIIIHKDAWVYPKIRNRFPVGFIVQWEHERKYFPTADQALNYAKDQLSRSAQEQAKIAGASQIKLETEQLPDGGDSYRIRVTASGNPIMKP